ncbi:MAG: ADP-ribosyltransferase [Solirubrobacteraceae bacterium]
MAGVPREVAAAMDEVERFGDRVQQAATRRVAKRTAAMSGVLAAILWQGDQGGTVVQARHAAGRLVEQVLGRPGPPLASLEESDARWLNDRIGELVARGEEVIDINGRWMRPSYSGKQDWTPVETRRMLVQQRAYRGRLQARDATLKLARKLRIDPYREVNGRQEWSDPRLKAHYERLTAVHAGRVAHDATVDAFRDAMFEQIAADPELIGWRRLAEPTACAACLALADGRVHTDRRMLRHTRCRCIPVPVTATSAPLPTGRELFDAMSEEEQDQAFGGRGGRVAAQALRDGKAELTDFVQIDEDRLERTDYVLSQRPTGHLAEAARPSVRPLVGAAETERYLEVNHTPTGDAASALERYSTPGHADPVNHGLRGREPLTDEAAGLVAELDRAMAPIDRPILGAFRGLAGVGDWLADPASLRPGDELHDDGFVSVSLDAAVSEGYAGEGGGLLLQLRVPAGTPVAWVAPVSQDPDERELLLPRGGRIVLDEVDATTDPVFAIATFVFDA